MIPESTKKKREETFFKCRRLISKINGSIQEESQESTSLGKSSIQTPKDSNQIYNICECCLRNGLPNEKMTRIRSGQRLCPACLSGFYAAAASQRLAFDKKSGEKTSPYH